MDDYIKLVPEEKKTNENFGKIIKYMQIITIAVTLLSAIFSCNFIYLLNYYDFNYFFKFLL